MIDAASKHSFVESFIAFCLLAQNLLNTPKFPRSWKKEKEKIILVQSDVIIAVNELCALGDGADLVCHTLWKLGRGNSGCLQHSGQLQSWLKETGDGHLVRVYPKHPNQVIGAQNWFLKEVAFDVILFHMCQLINTPSFSLEIRLLNSRQGKYTAFIFSGSMKTLGWVEILTIIIKLVARINLIRTHSEVTSLAGHAGSHPLVWLMSCLHQLLHPNFFSQREGRVPIFEQIFSREIGCAWLWFWVFYDA